MANIENLKLWISDLRDGGFEQTRGALRRLGGDDGPTYCCLGVACVTYSKATGKNLEELLDGRVVLPPEVVAWLGLDPDSNGERVPLKWDENSGDEGACQCADCGGVYTAMTANDRDRKTFAAIADLVEETYINEGSTIDG